MRLLRSIVLMCVVVAARVAQAAPPDVVLFPAAPLAADGERTHELRLYVVTGDALAPGLPTTVKAQKGAIVGAPSASGDGGVVVRYRPPRVTAPGRDTLTVAIGGRETRLPLALEPTGRLKLIWEVPDAPLVLARDAKTKSKTTLTLHVRDAAGRPQAAPLRVSASIGSVAAARETALGEYSVEYTAPDARYPEVAIVAAVAVSDGAFAAAPLKLAAHVTVDGEGEAGASMKISVDGQPPAVTTIGADGRFSLPLIVPPGGRAVGVSVDALGNQLKRDLDLALPPFPRLLVAAVPSELPADGRAQAEVVAYAVDARGNPERASAPELTADAGTLSAPEARGDGSTAWTFTAPATMGAGEVKLRAAGGGEARVLLRAGRPQTLLVTPPKEPLSAGLDRPVTLEARLADAAGAPVAGAELRATLAGGRVTGVHDRGGGRYAIEVIAPRDAGRGAAQLHVEVASVPPGPPRRVTLHWLPVTDGRDDRWTAEAWLDDDVGLPVANAAIVMAAPQAHLSSDEKTDRFGTARLRFPPATTRTARVTAEPVGLPGVGAALDLLVVGGVVHAVASTTGGGVADAEVPVAPPSFPMADIALPLRPPTFADVRLSFEPQKPRVGQPVRVHVDLRVGDPSQLLYQASSGSLEVVRPPGQGPGELRFIPPDDTRPGARYIISVTDAKTHVTAFTEIQVQ